MSTETYAETNARREARPVRVRIRDDYQGRIETAGTMIAARRPFNAGNMRGGYQASGSLPWSTHLPADLRARFADDAQAAAKRGAELYVVWSYDTPIGWAADDGETLPVVPRTRYSMSTGRHQHITRYAFEGPGQTWETVAVGTGRVEYIGEGGKLLKREREAGYTGWY